LFAELDCVLNMKKEKNPVLSINISMVPKQCFAKPPEVSFRTGTYLLKTFVVFRAVKIQVVVFWVVTPCSVVVGYPRFGGLSASILTLLTVYLHE